MSKFLKPYPQNNGIQKYLPNKQEKNSPTPPSSNPAWGGVHWELVPSMGTTSKGRRSSSTATAARAAHSLGCPVREGQPTTASPSSSRDYFLALLHLRVLTPSLNSPAFFPFFSFSAWPHWGSIACIRTPPFSFTLLVLHSLALSRFIRQRARLLAALVATPVGHYNTSIKTAAFPSFFFFLSLSLPFSRVLSVQWSSC